MICSCPASLIDVVEGDVRMPDGFYADLRCPIHGADAVREMQRQLALTMERAQMSVAALCPVCPGCGNRRDPGRPGWCINCEMGLAND